MSSNAAFSTKCATGYSVDAATGVCKACASFCNKCDISGAGLCDINQCTVGYTRDPTSLLCVNCLNACPNCSPTDPSVCLNCGLNRFLSNSICLVCSSNCMTCTSATVCTNCIEGYLLINSKCYSPPPFPCLGYTSSLTCSGCFKGFSLANNVCSFSNSCSSNSSC